MNLFDVSKNREKKENKKDCLFCDNSFEPDKRNLSRGWGFFCSKSCSIKYRYLVKRLKKDKNIKELRILKLKKLGIKDD